MIKINGEKIEIQEFPNGERNIKTDLLNHKMFEETVEVEMIYETDLDIIDLIIVKRHMDERCQNIKCNLLLGYIPYSRMDRTESKFAFTLKYFAEIINSLNFNEVIAYDVHSDVSLALFNNIRHISIIENEVNPIISKVMRNTQNPLYLVIPDLGASKRYKNIFKITEVLGIAGIIVMDKVRDFTTGQIQSIVPINKEIIKDDKFDILIVDDLCSFGGTFIRTFEVLKEYGCENANLFITHCENNITKGKVLEIFNQVFTTNSILDIEKVNMVDRNKITLI